MKLTKRRLREIIREELYRDDAERGGGSGIKTTFPDFHFLAKKATPTGGVGLWGGGNTAEGAAEHAQKWVKKGYEIVQTSDSDDLRHELEALGIPVRRSE